MRKMLILKIYNSCTTKIKGVSYGHFRRKSVGKTRFLGISHGNSHQGKHLVGNSSHGFPTEIPTLFPRTIVCRKYPEISHALFFSYFPTNFPQIGFSRFFLGNVLRRNFLRIYFSYEFPRTRFPTIFLGI